MTKPQQPVHRTADKIVSGVGDAGIIPAPSNGKPDPKKQPKK